MSTTFGWTKIFLAGTIVLTCISGAEAQKCGPGEFMTREDAKFIYCKKLPNWASVVRSYNKSRTIMRGIAPEENRCAMALSAALDLKPRAHESSLADLPDSVHRSLRGAGVLDRYYVRAAELKNRLVEEPPYGKAPKVYADSDAAREQLRGRRGIIYFERGESNPAAAGSQFDPRTGNHIDVWDRQGTVSGYVYRRAQSVWFWESPD